MLFLIDGGYHVLFAVYELCDAKAIDPFDFDKAEQQIPAAVVLLGCLVDDEMEADDTFTANRYFKDAKTKASVQRAVVQQTTGKKPARIG